MTKAMQDAGVAPDEIDYIAAHGTATRSTTRPRRKAIKGAFGGHAHKVAISSTKSMVGHLVGAAGIASALAAVGAIRDGVIAPTINLDEPDPECDLDYVPLAARRPRSTRRRQRLRLRRPERRGGLPPSIYGSAGGPRTARSP